VTEEELTFLCFNDIRYYNPFRYSLRKKDVKERRSEKGKKQNREEIEKLLLEEKIRQKENSFDAMNKKMHQLLLTRDSISSDEFPIESEEDMLFIYRAIVFSTHKERCYDISFKEETTKTEYMEYNKYTITRREK